jgi:hypothetical protein
MPDERVEAFDVGALAVARAASGDTYLEFLRRDSMSAGLYVLCDGHGAPYRCRHELSLAPPA